MSSTWNLLIVFLLMTNVACVECFSQVSSHFDHEPGLPISMRAPIPDAKTPARLLYESFDLQSRRPVGQAKPRAGISGGMGVNYVHPQDIVDIVNSTPGASERVSQFKSAVEFFGAVTIPVDATWILKLEYAYLLGSYNINSLFGAAEFTFTAHLPTLFVQYVLVEEGVYNVKIGAGAGYHYGSLSEKFATVDDRYTGKGAGMAFDLEANTAFGENFFGYLGGNLRWEFIGDLTNVAGKAPGVTANGTSPTLHLFGLGARLGFTYYF